MTSGACRRLTVSGRVQGVGFRAWLASEAGALGLSGWVRNRRDGTVEAELSGQLDALDRLADLCRRGPALAAVREVRVEPCTAEGAWSGVELRPTV